MLAIVDADHDHLSGTICADPNLMVTPTRDSEGMVLSTNALQKVLIEFDLSEHAFGSQPEGRVLRAMAPLGHLRYVIQKRGWSVRLQDINFEKFISPTTLECEVDLLCEHLGDLTLTKGVGKADFLREVQSLGDSLEVFLLTSRGHDITAMLAWAIQSTVGVKRKAGGVIKSQMIESYLRTAYPEAEFLTTGLAAKISAWELRNRPYRVLRR